MKKRLKKYQVLLHDEFCFGFTHFKKDSCWSLIYDWIMSIGFLEIRKWHALKPGEVDRFNKEFFKR
jgi:hypothetical protein